MDFFSSFFQNIKDKISNPFFGTLAFILIFHHWTFWYALFNFEESHNLAYRIAYLQTLAKFEFSSNNIFCIDIPFALIITVIGYFVVVATRSLSLWIEGKVWPWITGKLISKTVVLKEDHEKIISERDMYFDQYEKERKSVRGMVRDYDELIEINRAGNENLRKTQIENNDVQLSMSKITEEVHDLKIKLSVAEFEAKSAVENLNSIKRSNDTKIAENQKNINDLIEYKKFYFDEAEKSYYTSPSQFPLKVFQKAYDLINDQNFDRFVEVASWTKSGGSVNDSTIEQIKKYKVFNIDNTTIKLTPIGEILYFYRDIFIKIDSQIKP